MKCSKCEFDSEPTILIDHFVDIPGHPERINVKFLEVEQCVNSSCRHEVWGEEPTLDRALRTSTALFDYYADKPMPPLVHKWIRRALDL